MSPRRLGVDGLDRVLDDVLDEAVGRGHRRDPVVGGTGGPAGNARLTAWVGVLLLVVIAAELVTLLDVTALIDWHVGIGIALTALVLLKTGSTTWRIARYYAGAATYRAAGPPPLLLRLLGPLVIVATLGVLGSGFALIVVGSGTGRRAWSTLLGQQLSLVTVHQVFFVFFLVVAGLHLLARFVPALSLTVGRPRRPEEATVPGGRRRLALIAAAGLAAVIGVVLVLPSVGGWGDERSFDRGHPTPDVGVYRR